MNINDNSTRNVLAVSGVIEALLLIALVAIVISTIQVVYIPQVMTQREADHMDQVSNQFTSMKAMIDIQIMTRSKVPMFSMITLGSSELPYFVTMPARGELSVPGGHSRIVIDYAEPFAINLSSIIFTAQNEYYTDCLHQKYILEGGGIIVYQPDIPKGKPVMRAAPSISAVNTTSKVNLYYDLPMIKGVAGKNVSESGISQTLIRTNFTGLISYQNYTTITSNIIIYSNYPNAWFDALNSTMGTLVKVTLDPSPTPTYVKIEKKSKDIGFYVKEYPIYAQIGPGWIV